MKIKSSLLFLKWSVFSWKKILFAAIMRFCWGALFQNFITFLVSDQWSGFLLDAAKDLESNSIIGKPPAFLNGNAISGANLWKRGCSKFENFKNLAKQLGAKLTASEPDHFTIATENNAHTLICAWSSNFLMKISHHLSVAIDAFVWTKTFFRTKFFLRFIWSKTKCFDKDSKLAHLIVHHRLTHLGRKTFFLSKIVGFGSKTISD